MKFVANTPGQVVVRVSGPQASGKSVFVREACEYLQTQDVSYHYEEEGETWTSFFPKNTPAMASGRMGDTRRGDIYKASRTNAKYVFIVEPVR